MREVYTGLMLPMIKGSLPDFTKTFETYARDLKQAAENGARGSTAVDKGQDQELQ